jgi:hypothetical protein
VNKRNVTTKKSSEPSDATRAYEESVAWLKECGLPDSASPDDGYPQAEYQLMLDLEKSSKLKPKDIDIITGKARLARMIVLRYKIAKSQNWPPALCMALSSVYQYFRQLDLVIRGRHSLEIERKKTENKGIASHAQVRQIWEERRTAHPDETKDAARKAILEELRQNFPKQTYRGVCDATREGNAGRPKGKPRA